MIEIETVQIPEKKFYSQWLYPDFTNSPHYVINTFKIGKYPVTQEQYEAVMGTNPSKFQGNPQNPVEWISWDDAIAFCQKLSQMTGKTYRLPTIDEWEYACRAETTTQFYFGDDKNQLGDYAWYGGNSEGKTHPVGQKLPNAWGLYDMIGNVWELGIDCYQKAYLRGGSWKSRSAYCLYVYEKCENILYTHERYENRSACVGFRVVCD